MKPWHFDEFKHIGVDFDDPQQVQQYEQRQNTGIEQEKALVERLQIASGMNIVEFGCGTGAFAIAAALAGAQVIAVDISATMLKYGQTKADQLGLTTIQFVHSGFLYYEHATAKADFVVTKYAFHHLPDFWKAMALRRIYELLNENGTFYLEDVVYSFAAQDAEHHLDEWIRQVSSESGDGFSRADFEMHIRDEYSTFGWILEGLLKQEGFSDVHANYSSPTYASYLCKR